MDRKKFIQTSGLGLGIALIPSLVQGKSTRANKNSTATADYKIVKDAEGDVLNVIGDIQTHKLAGSDTKNQLVEWVSNVEPGIGIPPHIHTKEDEIFRVLQGQIELMVDGKTTILNEGDLAFAPKNIPHSWKVIGTEKAKMMTTAFPAGIEYMFKELAKLPDGPPDFAKVSEICAKHGVNFL